MPKRKKSETAENMLSSEHTIPGPVSPEVLKKAILKRTTHEEQAIRDYVEWQSPDEQVTHLEKVATKRLFERKFDVWDVRTNKTRYWVITSPTNLYSQELFPSLDYTLSFHVGVTTRVMAHEQGNPAPEQQNRLATAWRRWQQATKALDQADEAEEFQAVGMRCRESLLAFVRAVAKPSMVSEGQEIPKDASFIQWSELIANTIAQGASAQEIRGYLKALAKSTWQLVNWLTHASNAARFDGYMAIDATNNTLAAFGTALVRYERGTPDRCPRCSSYKLTSVYRPDLDIEPPYITLCESCGGVAIEEDNHNNT